MAIQLTTRLAIELDFSKVVYVEHSHPGAMGNAGGVVLEVFDGVGLIRYETNWHSDRAAVDAVAEAIKNNHNLFVSFYGGFGNGVYFRKGAEISVDTLGERFLLIHEGRRYPFSSSVSGVFRRIAPFLMQRAAVSLDAEKGAEPRVPAAMTPPAPSAT